MFTSALEPPERAQTVLPRKGGISLLSIVTVILIVTTRYFSNQKFPISNIFFFSFQHVKASRANLCSCSFLNLRGQNLQSVVQRTLQNCLHSPSLHCVTDPSRSSFPCQLAKPFHDLTRFKYSLQQCRLGKFFVSAFWEMRADVLSLLDRAVCLVKVTSLLKVNYSWLPCTARTLCQ